MLTLCSFVSIHSFSACIVQVPEKGPGSSMTPLLQAGHHGPWLTLNNSQFWGPHKTDPQFTPQKKNKEDQKARFG